MNKPFVMEFDNRLSEHFTLKEMTKTNTGLPNKITKEEIYQNLKDLVIEVLEPLRELYGLPIIVNSGYRSFDVNNAVNGSRTSQHQKGQAADITTRNGGGDNFELFELIKDNLVFDQLCWEFGDDNNPQWIHVSWSDTYNRNQILRVRKAISGRTIYENYE